MATAGRILIIPKGKYNEETQYEMLDMVSYGGKGWVCKKTCIGIAPEDGEYWAECIDVSEEFDGIDSKIDAVDAKVTAETTARENAIAEVNDKADVATNIAKGRNRSLAYKTYQEMVTDLNAMESDALSVGQNIYIGTVGIPDVWVYEVATDKVEYTYVSDEVIVSEVEGNTSLQIGYYRIAFLEGQKVDLTTINEEIDEINSNLEPKKFNYIYSADMQTDVKNCIEQALSLYGEKTIVASWMSQLESGGGAYSGILIATPIASNVINGIYVSDLRGKDIAFRYSMSTQSFVAFKDFTSDLPKVERGKTATVTAGTGNNKGIASVQHSYGANAIFNVYGYDTNLAYKTDLFDTSNESFRVTIKDATGAWVGDTTITIKYDVIYI